MRDVLSHTARLAARGAALGLVAACSNLAPVEAPYFPHYNNAVATYAAVDRDLLVEVHGTDGTRPPAAFAADVAAAMQGQTELPGVTFTTEPTPRTRAGYRVVMEFNGPVAVTGDALCAGPPRPIAQGERPLRIAAAFCARDQMLSRVYAKVADPALIGAVVGEVTRELLPRESPDERRFGGQVNG